MLLSYLKTKINQRQHNNSKPDFNTSVSAHIKKNHMTVILVHTDVTSNEKKK